MAKNLSKSRMGFVYAAQHPQHPKWVKIGFTRRTPFRRLLELSGTNTPSPFVLVDARFVWDALSAEHTIHQWLMQHNVPRQKEFFELDPQHIPALLDVVETHDARPPARKASTSSDVYPTQMNEEEWDLFSAHLADDQQQRWGDEDARQWASADLLAKHVWVQQRGHKMLERQCANGDAHASVALAEHLMRQDLSLDQWRHADCLFRAACKQGQPHAALRSLFWHTQCDPTVLPQYWEALWPWRESLSRSEVVPDLVVQTFAEEQQLWAHHPDRMQSWTTWCAQKSPPPVGLRQ